MLRLALIGKVITVGDAVSLLPQDLAPQPGSDVAGLRGQLSRAIGATWTNELLTVTATEPAGTVAVGPSTVVVWRDGARPAPEPAATRAATALVRTPPSPRPRSGSTPRSSRRVAAIEETAEPVAPVADLVGAEDAARKLTSGSSWPSGGRNCWPGSARPPSSACCCPARKASARHAGAGRDQCGRAPGSCWPRRG